MRIEGNIRRWDDARGFGFIKSAGSRDVFFHIRDFHGDTAPVVGQRVSYEEILVGGKGPRAMDIRPATEARSTPAAPTTGRHHRSLPTSGSLRSRHVDPLARHPRRRVRRPASDLLVFLLILAWLGLLAWGGWSQRLPPALLATVAAINVVTLASYAMDKRAARRGQWRTNEKTLHMLALLGGWPAAWWAQQWLHHKSSKMAFRRLYWLTVAIHLAALMLLLGYPEQLSHGLRL